MVASAPSFAPEEVVDELDRALDEGAEGSAAGRLRRGEVPAGLLVRPSVTGLTLAALEDWAVMAVAWAGVAWAPPWAYPLCVVAVAGRIHALGVLCHDACHMPLRDKTWRARLLEALAGYPLGTTLDAMRYHHLRHHRDNGMPTDPYFKKGLPGRPFLWVLQWLRGILLLPFWTLRPTFGLLAAVFPGMRNAYGRAFLQDRSGRDLRDSPEVLACARAELGQLVFQAVVFAAWLRFPDLVLRGYILPAWLTGLLASYRLLREHTYEPVTDRRTETIVATTCDHGLSFWHRFFLAPRNIGHHVVHHLHPQVAWDRLPALTAWYRSRHPELYTESAR